jgi:hypothetical protein
MVAQRAAMPQALRYPQTMAARAVRRWARARVSMVIEGRARGVPGGRSRSGLDGCGSSGTSRPMGGTKTGRLLVAMSEFARLGP